MGLREYKTQAFLRMVLSQGNEAALGSGQIGQDQEDGPIRKRHETQ